jgi:hypothetical protein
MHQWTRTTRKKEKKMPNKRRRAEAEGNESSAASEGNPSSEDQRAAVAFHRKGICTHDACNNIAQKKGLCKSHGGFTVCSIQDCVRHVYQKGFCGQHFREIEEERHPPCEAPGCKRSAKVNQRCLEHYRAQEQKCNR